MSMKEMTNVAVNFQISIVAKAMIAYYFIYVLMSDENIQKNRIKMYSLAVSKSVF